MIENSAKNGLKYVDICESIDFLARLIKYEKAMIKKRNLPKSYKEIFKLLNRIPLQEKEDVKNKLGRFFFTIE